MAAQLHAFPTGRIAEIYTKNGIAKYVAAGQMDSMAGYRRLAASGGKPFSFRRRAFPADSGTLVKKEYISEERIATGIGYLHHKEPYG